MVASDADRLLARLARPGVDRAEPVRYPGRGRFAAGFLCQVVEEVAPNPGYEGVEDDVDRGGVGLLGGSTSPWVGHLLAPRPGSDDTSGGTRQPS